MAENVAGPNPVSDNYYVFVLNIKTWRNTLSQMYGTMKTKIFVNIPNIFLQTNYLIFYCTKGKTLILPVLHSYIISYMYTTAVYTVHVQYTPVSR